jgi:hypothetical protein
MQVMYLPIKIGMYCISSKLLICCFFSSSNVHHVVVVAHTPEAIQFALGLTGGIVYVMIGRLQFLLQLLVENLIFGML